MRNRKHKILIFSLLLFAAISAKAQFQRDYNWYFNANFGITQTYCDLQEDNNHISKLNDETKLAYGIQLARYISPVFAIQAQFLRAQLKGAKNSTDAEFESDLFEYNLGTRVNFSNLFFKNRYDRTVTVYGATGLGLVFFRSESTRISNGNLVSNYGYDKDNGSKDARVSSLVFPLGAGVDFRLSPRWNVTFESVLRLMNTDKLDAIKSGDRDDAYFYTGIGVAYNFDLFGRKTKPIEEPKEEIPVVEEKEITNPPTLTYELPDEITSYSEFDFTFTIDRGEVGGMAELMQILPIGFEVLDSTVNTNPDFNFRNYTVNMVWDQLPQDSVFTISYRVQIGDVYGSLPITSILYSDEAGKEYEFKTNIYVAKEQEEVEIAEVDTIPDEPVVQEKPKDSIEFRVQVRAAYKAKISLERLAEKYNLHQEIQEDFVGNWYRYSIGSFDTYSEAKEYRRTVVNQHKVLDAFVVAFIDGKRLNSLSELKQIKPKEEPSDNTTTFTEQGRVFRVQILALLHNKVDPETLQDIYGIKEEITEEQYGNWRKYTVGEFKDYNKAKEYLEKVRAKGIKDAFIAVYDDGKRLTMD